MRDFWTKLAPRASRLLEHFALHFGAAVVVIIGFFLVERLVLLLWNDQIPAFFDRVPIRYVFHAMDLAVLGCVLVAILIRIFRE
jgi:hypothetical protein